MGKPVVATETMAMNYFSEYVSLAQDKDGWLYAIEKEIKQDSERKKNERISFASGHTWMKNVDNIYEQINKIKFTRNKNVA